MYFLLGVSIVVLGILLDLAFFHWKTNRDYHKKGKFPFSEDEFEKIFFLRETETQWLGNLAATSTLLGLLGTVLGIHSAFENMKIYKQASPEIFAAGISEALLTTIFGLSIAIPSTLGMYLFRNLLDSLALKVEKNQNHKENTETSH